MNDSEYDVSPRYAQKRTGASPWIKFGIPVLVVVVIGAVVGGVLGSRHHSNNSTSTSPSASGTATQSGVVGVGLFYTATDGYGLPVYPSSVSMV